MTNRCQDIIDKILRMAEPTIEHVTEIFTHWNDFYSNHPRLISTIQDVPADNILKWAVKNLQARVWSVN